MTSSLWKNSLPLKQLRAEAAKNGQLGREYNVNVGNLMVQAMFQG